jgi:hypothetical protein
MKTLIVVALLSSPAVAQDDPVREPVCQPIGRTDKGDLVYSIECRHIPGLKAGINGYNPVSPTIVKTIPIEPDQAPEGAPPR